MIDEPLELIDWLFAQSQRSALASILWTVVTTVIAASLIFVAKGLVSRWIPSAVRSAAGKIDRVQAGIVGRATRIAYEADQTRLLLIVQNLHFRFLRSLTAYLFLLLVQVLLFHLKIQGSLSTNLSSLVVFAYLGAMVWVFYDAMYVKKLLRRIFEIYDERLSIEGKLGKLSEKPMP